MSFSENGVSWNVDELYVYVSDITLLTSMCQRGHNLTKEQNGHEF